MVAVGLSWLLFAATYLAFVGSVSPAEGAAAVLGGGLAALWTARLRATGGPSLRVPASALARIGPVLLALPGQTVRIGARLWRAALRGDVAGASRYVDAREAFGGPATGEGSEAAGARAVAVFLASLSPDAYVLRCEPERGRVLLHGLGPAGGR